MARDGKQVDRSAPDRDGEQRFSLDQLQQLLEALRLVSEQEAERQMWRDVEDPRHPMTSDPPPVSGSGGNAREAGPPVSGSGGDAQGAGTVTQGGHSGCAVPPDLAPPVCPPSPGPSAPRLPSGPQGTSHVPVAPVVGNGNGNHDVGRPGFGGGNNDVGRCGGCCNNCDCYNRNAEDMGPGGSTGKLRWYSITKGKAIGVFCDWAIVGPLVLNVPGAMYARYPTFSAALVSFMGAVDRGHVGIIA